MARKQTGSAKVWLLLVETIGLALSFYLILVSLGLIHGGEAPCPRGGIFACHSALTGRYSKIGPIPISLLGVAYFSFQILLTVVLQKRGWTVWLKGLSVLASLFFVAYLRAIELLWMKAICVWCWAVAVAALAQALAVIPHLTPPLPRLGIPARVGGLLALFVLLFAVSMGVAMMLPEHQRVNRTSPSRQTATPKPTPQPTATPRTQGNQAAAVTPTPTPVPTATPDPDAAFDFPEEEMTAEQLILKAHGWRVVTAATPIERAIPRKPVVMLAFSSDCRECQAFIHGALSTNALEGLDVGLYAIDETMLRGKLSEMVSNVPTTVLLDRQGKLLFKHEGRMTEKDLRRSLEAALQMAR